MLKNAYKHSRAVDGCYGESPLNGGLDENNVWLGCGPMVEFI
jgi:hypothetical protein